MNAIEYHENAEFVNLELVEVSQNQPLLNGFIPPFVNKLWAMVNENSEMCYWGDNGKTVKVNQDKKMDLKHYFKSAVVSSFIRQFNMYGFSKEPNRDNHSNIIEFKNDFFQQGRPELLEQIKRKPQKSRMTKTKSESPKVEVIKREAKSPTEPKSSDIQDRLTKVEGELEKYKDKFDFFAGFMQEFLKPGHVKIPNDAIHHKYDVQAIRKRQKINFTITSENLSITGNIGPAPKVRRTSTRRTRFTSEHDSGLDTYSP